jgi:hypothetical protein
MLHAWLFFFVPNAATAQKRRPTMMIAMRLDLSERI